MTRRPLFALLLITACADAGSDDDTANPESGVAPETGGDDSGSSGGPSSASASSASSSAEASSTAQPESTGGEASSGDDTDEPTTGVQPDPGNVWFREPFEELGAQNMYGFANRFPQSETTWTTEHVAGAGWNGTSGAHVTVHGCTGCNTSENQFNIGWSTPALADLGKPTTELGDEVFIRWRIRFDEGHRWSDGGPMEASAKFVLYGSTGEEPNSRVIIHLFNPYENGGCSLGFDYSFTDPPYAPEDEWVTPQDWGLPNGSWSDEGLSGHVGSFSPHVNIGWDCAPGVLVTHAGGVDLPPQHVGAAPQDGWYHLQFALRSGVDGTARFRIWANNNDVDAPSSERNDFDLQILGWDSSVDFGGYWGVATENEMGFIVDDLEVGDGFDAAWYPG
jgi:hypothetical protein